MATYVAKIIENSSPIPMIKNNISIYNPENIEDWRINYYLIHTYFDLLSKSYNVIKYQQNNLVTLNKFDRIELLTIHSYDDSIKQYQNDRLMINCYLINMKESNLKSLNNYLKVIQMIIEIPSLNTYLQENVIPIVVDFSDQLFITKAIILLNKQKKGQSISIQIPNIINNFIPILRLLYILLNMREDIILVHWNFFEKLFKSVFGKNKIFAKKPKPWKINLLLELANSA